MQAGKHTSCSLPQACCWHFAHTTSVALTQDAPNCGLTSNPRVPAASPPLLRRSPPAPQAVHLPAASPRLRPPAAGGVQRGAADGPLQPGGGAGRPVRGGGWAGGCCGARGAGWTAYSRISSIAMICLVVAPDGRNVAAGGDWSGGGGPRDGEKGWEGGQEEEKRGAASQKRILVVCMAWGPGRATWCCCCAGSWHTVRCAASTHPQAATAASCTCSPTCGGRRAGLPPRRACWPAAPAAPAAAGPKWGSRRWTWTGRGRRRRRGRSAQGRAPARASNSSKGWLGWAWGHSRGRGRGSRARARARARSWRGWCAWRPSRFHHEVRVGDTAGRVQQQPGQVAGRRI